MIDIFLGLFLGLLSATVSESVGHRIFGHPSKAQLRPYHRYPGFFAPFLRAYYHHFVIHHELTFQQDLLTQFTSAEDKRRLDNWISQTFPVDFANLIWTERYNLTLIGMSGTLPFAIPFLTGPLLILVTLGKVAFAASLFSAFSPVLFSKYLHPYIHQPQDLITSPKIFQRIARTRYMRWVFLNHFLHHKHPERNFNLLLGGDYLVGVHQEPLAHEKAEYLALWARFERSWNT